MRNDRKNERIEGKRMGERKIKERTRKKRWEMEVCWNLRRTISLPERRGGTLE